LNDELDESNFEFNTRTHIYNVSDLDFPVYVGFFEHETASIDHNLYTLNNLAFMSNYTAGLRIMDISDIATGDMTELAYFDIEPISDQPSFAGTWSNYPYFESGNVIISGFDGFWVVRPNEDIMIGIDTEEATVAEFNVWPIPAQDQIKVFVTGITNSTMLRITDGSGRIVKEWNEFPAWSGELTLDIQDLTDGLYFLSLPEFEKTVRFVKQ
jgi:hypothetical protein